MPQDRTQDKSALVNVMALPEPILTKYNEAIKATVS